MVDQRTIDLLCAVDYCIRINAEDYARLLADGLIYVPEVYCLTRLGHEAIRSKHPDHETPEGCEQ